MRSARAPARSRSRTTALLVLGVADVAFAFQQTAVIPAIPTIKQDLHATQAWSAWLVSGYLVASSIATPLLGKLGDRYGRRRMLSVSLALFLAGSIGASLAPGIGALIGFRALQGAGGAVFPLSLSIAREQLSEERVGVGVGLLTGAFGVGTTLGFAVSGAIVEAASWRWVFAAGAITILVALILLPIAVPRSEQRNEAGLDLLGGALMTGGIALVLIGLTEGVTLGWSDWRVIALFAGGAAALGGWAWHDLHAREPLIDLTVLSSRPVLLTNGATLMLGYALFALYFLVPFFVSSRSGNGYGFGAGPLETGLYLVPAAAGQLVAGSASGFVAQRLGTKWVFTIGMILTAGSAAWLALLHAQVWEILAAMLALGLGNGLAIGTASALITETAHGTETGIATALNSVVRRVGGGFGSQISAALLAGITLSTGGPAQLAFVIAFWICAGAAFLGSGLAAGIS